MVIGILFMDVLIIYIIVRWYKEKDKDVERLEEDIFVIDFLFYVRDDGVEG